MRDQHRALLLGFAALMLGGCKKDKDVEAPSVRILTPIAGSTLAIPDTLTVRVEVSDDRTVEHLTVSLLDGAGNSAGPFRSTPVNASSATVEIDLIVTSERLASGSYQIEARASDGDNDGRAFQDIVVQAAPLRVRSIFIAPPSTTAPPYPITRVDSSGAIITWTTLSELGGAAIDLDHLYTSGTLTQPLQRWQIGTGSPSTLLASENVPGATAPYFNGLMVDPSDGRTYVGTINGAVRAFNPQGTGAFTANSPVGSYSQLTAVVNDLIVSATWDPVPGQHMLVNHAYSSGVLLGQFPLDVSPIALFPRGSDHVLVFGNRNGDGVIQDRSLSGGGVFEMQVFTGDPIQAVARIDDMTFMVATAAGMVRFTYQNNGISPIASGLSAEALVYDPASGSLLAGVGDQLITMDPMLGTQIDSRTMPTTIGTILLLMNR